MKNYAADFPAINQQVNGKRLVYLDSAATAQRPKQVLDAMTNFYSTISANPHRGIYTMGAKATLAYEGARETVAGFVGVKPEEIVFTRNATEALNLVAFCYAAVVLKPGDSVVITIAEHHSNLVPWQRAAKAAGARLVYLYLDKDGNIPEEEINAKIDETTRLVAFAHVSNVLGNRLPVAKLVRRAKEVGAKTVLDCAQSIPHFAVDLHALDVDFAAFSGHKLYAPMGIGALYARLSLLEEMPPFLAGGDMIEYVEQQNTTYAPPPQKFEAGTQNAGGAVGFAAAIKYVQAIGWPEIEQHEVALMRRLVEGLSQIPHVHILGNQSPAAERYGVVSFTVDDVHPHDVSSILDNEGIAVRAGHHCAQPLLTYLGVASSCRASLGLYNTTQDVDALLEALPKTRRWLGYGD